VSQPKELYRFVEGATVWTLTSGDASVTYNSETYTPEAISRTEAESKGELAKSNIQVKLDIDNVMARRWLTEVIDAVVSLTLFSSDSGTTISIWKGRLSSVKPDTNTISLVFESIFTSLRRPGLRLKFQRNCPHSHYGRGCGLNKESWDISGTVSAVTEITVVMPVAAGYADGHFTAGMIEAPDGSLRFITSHVGSTLTMIRKVQSILDQFALVGPGVMSLRIFPGCDRTPSTCLTKFNNLANNGACPFIPLKNPFGGTSIV
jgi:uncharacterized phage protein (TIGR02218 family)